jgi:hypothetical protein
MKNKQKMIAVKHKNPNKATKPFKIVRRDTEREIMQRQVLRFGFIRLRVSLSIYDKEVFNYAAWRECNLFVDCPDVDTAVKFRNSLEIAIGDVGETMKLEVKATKTLGGK